MKNITLMLICIIVFSCDDGDDNPLLASSGFLELGDPVIEALVSDLRFRICVRGAGEPISRVSKAVKESRTVFFASFIFPRNSLDIFR